MQTPRDFDLFASERQQMVVDQLLSRDIRNERVLKAMRQVPRHCFVPEEHQDLAYADGPLPIGSGQTISQPYIVALMTQLLCLSGSERVLEVGTGSGYQAAILGQVAAEVHSIERHPNLADRAAKVIQQLGYTNIFIHLGDGSLGLPEHAPYQGILVTAAAPRAPDSLLSQLDEAGTLVIPIGGPHGQILERWLKIGKNYERESLTMVAFVPLRGKAGWDDRQWGF